MRRLAIVGCGAVLEGVHAEPLRRLMRDRELEVVALVDPTAEARERAAASFPGARLGPDPEIALAGTADSVLVLSPPHTHADIVVRALESGLNVLCEKPLTDTPKGADAIAAAADAAAQARVAMIRRQFDTHHILRRYKSDLVDESDFRITYREGAPFTWPVKSSAPFFRGPGEAGVLVDVGSHVIDLLLWLFGGNCVVSSYGDNADATLAETDAELLLGLDGGEASVQLSRRQPLAEGWLVESKRGQVWVPLGPRAVIFVRSPGSRSWRQLRQARRSGWRPCTSYDEAAYRQLDQFLFGNAELQASLEEGLRATRVLLDAYAMREVAEPADATHRS